MLVLSRKIGQGVRVGDDIRITVVKVDRNSVRIGIEAGDDITVRREEILVFDSEELEVEGSEQAGVGIL